MNLSTLPIIQEGQIYLNAEKTNYLVVTKNNLGHISYAGINFKGMQDAESFIETFMPVDPALIDVYEADALQTLCTTALKIGFISI